jgi:hypothetical protein
MLAQFELAMRSSIKNALLSIKNALLSKLEYIIVLGKASLQQLTLVAAGCPGAT